jgi:hypothetical protein
LHAPLAGRSGSRDLRRHSAGPLGPPACTVSNPALTLGTVRASPWSITSDGPLRLHGRDPAFTRSTGPAARSTRIHPPSRAKRPGRAESG